MSRNTVKLAFAGLASAAVVMLAGVMDVEAFAATRTWTGAAGDNKFSTAGNWQENQAPAEGDTLVFGRDSRGDSESVDKRTLDNDLDVAFAGIEFVRHGEPYSHFTDYCVPDGISLIDGATVESQGDPSTEHYTSAQFWCEDGVHELNFLGDATVSTYLANVAVTVQAGHLLSIAGDGASLGAGSKVMGELSIQDARVDISKDVDLAHVHVRERSHLYILPDFNGDLDRLTVRGGGVTFGSPYIGTGDMSSAASKVTYGMSIVLHSDLAVRVNSGIDVTLTGDIQKNGHSLTLDPASGGKLTIGSKELVNPATKVTYSGDEVGRSETVVRNQIATLDGIRSSISVNDGGVLMGSGVAKNYLQVFGGGVLAPGNSPGVITSESLNLMEDSIYQVEIKDVTAHDKLVVSVGEWFSTSQIDGAILELSFLEGYAINKGDEFVIIDDQRQDASIEGTFKDLPEGAKIAVDGVVFSITYRGGDGNDVSLIALNDQSAPVLSAPNTGSKLVTANPVVIAMAGVVAAAAILFVAKRRTSN